MFVNVKDCSTVWAFPWFVLKHFPARERKTNRSVENIENLEELQSDDSAVIVYQDEAHFQVTTSVTRKWVVKGSEPKVKSAPSRKSVPYMWLYRTSGDTDRPIVLYEYQPDRKQEHPKEFLTGFRGYLHTDGYAGYHNLPESITVVGCWAHARRKFDEAMKSLPKGTPKTVPPPRGWLTAAFYPKLRTDWQAFLPKNAMTSG